MFWPERQDIVVLSVRLTELPCTFLRWQHDLDVFDTYEQELFSKVVALAEKKGKHVWLLVAPGTNAFGAAIMLTAQRVYSSRLVSDDLPSLQTPENSP